MLATWKNQKVKSKSNVHFSFTNYRDLKRILVPENEHSTNVPLYLTFFQEFDFLILSKIEIELMSSLSEEDWHQLIRLLNTVPWSIFERFIRYAPYWRGWPIMTTRWCSISRSGRRQSSWPRCWTSSATAARSSRAKSPRFMRSSPAAISLNCYPASTRIPPRGSWCWLFRVVKLLKNNATNYQKGRYIAHELESASYARGVPHGGCPLCR